MPSLSITMMQSTLDPPAALASPNPLLIPELLQCILGGFHLPKPGDNRRLVKRPKELRESQQALAALGQTCRALLEPSLDRLWQRLDSLEPLIRSFSPVYDWERARVPPSSAEWDIIARYSHRVHEVTFYHAFDQAFLSCASSCSPSHFLFPNLRALDWCTEPESWNSTASLQRGVQWILPPTVFSLSVSVERRYGIGLFLQCLIQVLPQLKLKSFDFSTFQCIYTLSDIVSESEIQQLSQVISTQEHLESLVVDIPIGDVLLRSLILSRKLKVASWVLHPIDSNLNNIRITSADIPFRNVKELKLNVWDLHFVSSLLRPLDQMFHTFHLGLNGLHNAETISAFLTILASPQRTDSLQSIRLTFHIAYHSPEHNIPYNNSVHTLTYRALYPLTSFKHLRELRLHPYNLIFLSDEELAELVHNWPMLEVLQLKCIHGCYGTPLTLRGLLSLLTLCPRLRELGLSLDAREVPETTSVDVRNTILTSINLPDSPIRNARPVADFFSRHLPFVKFIDTYFFGNWSTSYEPPAEYHLLWIQVREYLQGK